MKKYLLILAVFFNSSFLLTAQSTITTTDPAGNVGIGTAVPLDKLHIYGQDPSVRVETSNGNGGAGGSLIFGHNQSSIRTPVAKISSFLIDGSGGLRTGRLTFHTASWGALTQKMILNEFGRLGIGTIDPSNKLEVQGGGIYASDYISTSGNINGNGFRLPWSSGTDGLFYEAYGGKGMMVLKTHSAGIDIASNSPGNFIRFSTQGNEERMRINDVGNVNINNTLTVGDRIFATNKVIIGSIDLSKVASHSLAINGSAIANKIVVKTYPNWPDYVFNTNYKLRPLTEVEIYIKQNNHLPEVPSAEEVEKDGLDLGANQAALSKKIEELTLYVIDQNKQQELQKKSLSKLEKSLDEKQKLIEAQANLLNEQQQFLLQLKEQLKKQ